MGWAKELYMESLAFERTAAYEEAQSRLRLSMACAELVRPRCYDLYLRILELARFKQCPSACCGFCLLGGKSG